MNKNLLKGLGIGAAITALIAYNYFTAKLEAMETSYNNQLSVMHDESSESAKKNNEFVELGEECELVETLKRSLNFIVGEQTFDNENDLTEEFVTALAPVLENTNHFFNENNGLRKSFLYDINKTIANVIDVEVPERELRSEYTSGMLQKGSKGREVIELQELLNRLNAENETPTIELTGNYDKATYAIVLETFVGTTALIDIDSGAVSKEFVSNFTEILNNLNY